MDSKGILDPDSIGNVDDAVKLLNENGIQMTRDEFVLAISDGADELDENTLENVAGGSLYYAVKLLWDRWRGSSSGTAHGGGGRHG